MMLLSHATLSKIGRNGMCISLIQGVYCHGNPGFPGKAIEIRTWSWKSWYFLNFGIGHGNFFRERQIVLFA